MTSVGPQRSRTEKTRPCAETSIYQFRRVGLSASWSVGELVIGELNCRRVGLSASSSVSELSSYRIKIGVIFGVNIFLILPILRTAVLN